MVFSPIYLTPHVVFLFPASVEMEPRYGVLTHDSAEAQECIVQGGVNMSGCCHLRSLEEECDDGDLLDGDGCSRKCKKEKGFNCVGESKRTEMSF